MCVRVRTLSGISDISYIVCVCMWISIKLHLECVCVCFVSLPHRNASTVNLQYLTVEQSISDVAQLIRAAKADLPGAQDSKVILWGSGLGASLATWTKQKFPHLVHAVWSSSGAYQHVVHSAGKC